MRVRAGATRAGEATMARPERAQDRPLWLWWAWVVVVSLDFLTVFLPRSLGQWKRADPLVSLGVRAVAWVRGCGHVVGDELIRAWPWRREGGWGGRNRSDDEIHEGGLPRTPPIFTVMTCTEALRLPSGSSQEGLYGQLELWWGVDHLELRRMNVLGGSGEWDAADTEGLLAHRAAFIGRMNRTGYVLA